MNVATTPTEKLTKRSRLSPRAYILAVCLVLVAIAHGVAPKHLLLDWPMVSLLAMAAALCLVPFSTLLGLIEKLKYGEFEVLLRDIKKLNFAVEVIESTSFTEAEKEEAVQPEGGLANSAQQTIPSLPSPVSQEDFSSFGARVLHVMELQRVSSTAALVRLSMHIEEAVFALFTQHGGREVGKGTAILSALDLIRRKDVVGAELTDAIREFWKVRNRIVHSPTTGPVPDHIVDGAIDNGLVLLRKLLSMN